VRLIVVFYFRLRLGGCVVRVRFCVSRFWLALICSVTISGGPARGEAQPTPAEIKTRLEDILKALPPANSASDSAWRDQANALRARLATLKSGDDIAAATERSAELEALLKTLPTTTNTALMQALDKLTDAAATIEANEPVAALTKRVTRLEGLLKANDFPSSNSQVDASLLKLIDLIGKSKERDPVWYLTSSGNALVKVIQANKSLKTARTDVLKTTVDLLPLLEDVEEADPASAVQRRAAATTAMIERLVEKKPLKDSAAVTTALLGLSGKIASALASRAPRIHVIDASYGDHRDGVPKSRSCVATTGVNSVCERTTNCTLASLADVCGYDPAPQATASDKSLVVRYQCLVGDDALWGEVTGVPGKQALGVQVQPAEFRKDGQKLFCLIPER
jgi:hypothetical protein